MEIDFQEINKSVIPVFYGGECCESGHFFGPAVRPVYLLHYVISGMGRYTVGEQSFIIQAGEAFFIKPGEITFYQADSEHPWHYIWVAFSSDMDAFMKVPYHIKNKELQSIMERFDNPERILLMNAFHAAALTWSVTAALIEPVYQQVARDNYIETAVQLIKKRYTEKITVQEIADTLSLDRSYFSNLFKKEYGISPQKYLLYYRLKKAEELLLMNRYSISVIAVSVGFSDIYSFSHSFRKHFGKSPKEYLAELKRKI